MIKQTDKLTFKNYQLNVLLQVLDTTMNGAYARARSKFFILLRDQIELNEKARIEMITQYSDKDKKGEPIIDEKTNNYSLTEENTKLFNRDYEELLLEDFIIDMLPSNEDVLKKVAEKVLSSEAEFNIRDGEIYSQICDEFELKIK